MTDHREFARWVALSLLVAVVASFVVFAVPGVVGAEHSFVVLSGSMSPAIDPGDVVVVDRTDPSTIDEGDVITFVRGDSETPTTHRVVGVRGSNGRFTFETKGDANEDPDPQPVPESSVLGRVVLTIPYIGHVIRFANTAVGGILLFALPLGLLAVTEIRALLQAYPTEREATDETTEHDGEPASDGSEDRNGDAPPEATAATDEQQASGSDTETDEDPPQVTIDPGDLTVTTALLALLAPYTGYVAFQLQTALAFTVAFANVFSLLAVGGLWAVARPSVLRTRSVPRLLASSDDPAETTADRTPVEEHTGEGD
jgi:signal peptidase